MIINKKLIIIAVLILAIIGGFFIKQNRDVQAEKEKIQTTTVTRQNIAKTVSASGKIKALNSVDLKFQTSGRLVWVGVKEGDRVQAGQGLAQLDIEELKRNLQKELNEYLKKRWDFDEATQVTYKDSVLTNTVRRIIDKNQQDLNNAVLDVEIAKYSRDLALLWTPIAGIITHIDVPVAGVNITPAAAVFTVADPTSVIFSAGIDESDIAKVKIGQTAKISLDAYPEDSFSGPVQKIDFTPTTTSGGGTAFNTQIILPPNTDEKFKIGMNGDIEIVIEEKESVLVIPSSAVSDDDKVWILDDKGNQKQISVKTGLKSETETEITQGLKEGDKIIIGGKK